MARAAYAVLRRDLRIASTYRFAILSLPAGLIFLLVLFYYVSRLIEVEGIGSHDDYFAYVVVGIAVIAVLNATFTAFPASVQVELMAGTFERSLVSPFGPLRTIMAMTALPLFSGVLFAAIVLAMAALLFGVELRWETAWLLLPSSLLAWGAFAPFGLIVTAGVIFVKQAVSGMTWVVAGLGLIAGLYFPVAVLPDWIEWASAVQPLTPMVELLRHVLVGTPTTVPPAVDAVKVLAFAAVLMPASMLTLTAALRLAARRGTIMEY